MNSVELEERYRHLMSMPFSSLSFAGEDQYSGILLDQNLIRILLIRYSSDDNRFKVEVELQMTPQEQARKYKETKNQMLQSIITYIQYLIPLIHIGFELDIVGNSCIWSLSKEFQSEIDDETLKLLVPPIIDELSQV